MTLGTRHTFRAAQSSSRVAPCVTHTYGSATIKLAPRPRADCRPDWQRIIDVVGARAEAHF